MEIQFTNTADRISVADSVFSAAYNEPLIHQVVVAYLAGARQGTKAQKTKAEVSGGGVKPWKQKGTGRARAGSIRSPLWRTGGKIFAAKPRSYVQKVNRKMYRSALCSIFSELNRIGRFVAVNALELTEPKTKSFLKLMQDHAFGDDLLLITESENINIFLASRNLPNVTVIDVQEINPALLLKHEKVIVDKAALEKINEWLS